MRFTFEIGDKEKSKIEFSQNWLTGSPRVIVEGRQVAPQGPSIFKRFSFRLPRRYEFMVGSAEKHKVVLEKLRPLLYTDFRRQVVYRVFVNDKLVHEQQGF
jgi:hypothetical protein